MAAYQMYAEYIASMYSAYITNVCCHVDAACINAALTALIRPQQYCINSIDETAAMLC